MQPNCFLMTTHCLLMWRLRSDLREWCQQNEKLIMVGNMLGSSLAMAPALLAAQGADFVDLDGPMWQRTDVAPRLIIDAGCIQPPLPDLWG